MQDWDGDLLAGLVAFAAVSEAGSFAEAARRLGTSRSAISKQVQRIEARLGAKLLQRTTRALSLTEPGRSAYEHAAQVARSAAAARVAVESLTSAPRGRLRVTTSVAYGKCVLLGLVADFLKRYPDVEIDVVLLDRMVDLAEEGIDLAVRLSDTAPDLSIARRLRPIEYFLVASPTAKGIRKIKRPQDVGDANVLVYSRSLQGTTWTFSRSGEVAEVTTSGRMTVNNSEGLAATAASAFGIAIVPDYVAASGLAEGSLIRLLPKWDIQGRFGDTVWLVRSPDRSVLPAVRAFSDFLVQKLRSTEDAAAA